jgi:hypothetical protein
MDRFSKPLTLTPSVARGEFMQADVVFYEVEHRGPSFKALVFLNAPEADVDTPLEIESGFAGSFVIFGHGGCFGDEGHCHVPPGPRDPFDSRPPHGLTPQTKMVDVTEALKHPRCTGETLTITVLPIRPGRERPQPADVLSFSELRLLTYR